MSSYQEMKIQGSIYTYHIGCISLVSIACYLNALNGDLVFDDIPVIKDNKDLKPSTPFSNIFHNDFWGTPISSERSHKSYRPLTVLSFRINYFFHGLQPFGYHMLNILLHFTVSLLYYRLCLKLLNKKSAFLAAVMFAIHPIHTEAVSSIVGRAEILSAIFFILAFLTFLQSNEKISYNVVDVLKVSFLGGMAMLCKEQGVTVLLLCILTDLFIFQKLKLNEVSSWKKVSMKRPLCFALCFVVIAFCRAHVMSFTMPTFNRYDNPASVSSAPTRQLTFMYLAAYNSWLMAFPSSLCCDWTMSSIPLLKSIFDIRNIFTLAFLCAAFKLLDTAGILKKNKRIDRVLLVGILLTAVPFLPASNLLFTVGFVIAERVLYIPSMGFCLLVAHGFHILLSKFHGKSKILKLFLFVLIASHFLKTIRRNSDWNNEHSLYSSALTINPKNAKLLNNMGKTFEDIEKYQEAINYYSKSISVEPEDIVGYINAGRVYSTLNMHQEAENTFKKGKSFIPKTIESKKIPINHLKIFISLANVISKNSSRLEEANQLYLEVINLRHDYVEAYLNRGDILIKLNRSIEAKKVYESALKFNLNRADLLYNLAILSVKEGDILQALENLNKALDIEPDHEPSLLNSALLIQKHQLSAETLTAYHRLLKLVQSSDTYDENVYFNLGMLSLTAGSSWNAEYWFRKAVQVKEDFKSALFNLALLLSDQKRPLEAVTFINQLLKFHPNHTKALILMGDIYINNMNDLESAEQCYRKIMEIDPTDIQGLHNLCVIHYRRSNFLKAEKCLMEALKIAPAKDYVVKHLNLVRNKLKTAKETVMDSESQILSAFKYSSS